MSGKLVKPPATKNRPLAVGFVTQALETSSNADMKKKNTV
jgi:hypothetical protein